jgi:predicted hydrocarbon binding protein
MPDAMRLRLVTRIARRMVRQTYGGSRALVRWRGGRGSVDLRGSIFCEVRDSVEQPLCEFYASAIRRLMHLFNIQVEVGTDRCRATGAGQCLLSVSVSNPAKPGLHSNPAQAGLHEGAER